MKIALIGYGKMGQIIAQIAESRNHQIITVDPFQAQADCKDIKELAGLAVDCAIEFTKPNQAVKNIKALAELKIPQVIGTTGWYNEIPEVKELICSSDNCLIYGSNFSLGVNLFYKLVEQAAKLMNNFSNYDLGLIEYHHNQKADSPSGTAGTIAEILVKNITRKNKILAGNAEGKIGEDQLQVSSLRVGSFPGDHEVIFDSQADFISLKHSARNREGFALGAVIAAEWIQNRKGFYNVSDLVEDLINVKS